MEEKLRELLDKTYELEGLVYLAIQRTDLGNDFIKLIEKKGKDVSELCAKLEGEATEIPEIKDFQEEKDLTYTLDEYSLDEEPASTQNRKKEGRLVFSINERFRFRKELFNNSDADFNNTVALVASMEDYEEAEDFFLNEEGLDRNNPVVTEFLEIIKRYFR